MSEYMEFEQYLDDDDYGFIVSSDGKLKGLWIPKGYEEEEVPAPIVKICIEHFGIDPNTEQDTTIH